MSSIIRIPFLLFILLLNAVSWGNETTDSLAAELLTTSNTKEKIELQQELAWQYAGIDNKRSLTYAENSLELSLELGDNDLIATSYNRIGLAHDYSSNFELALWNYGKCLELRKKHSGPKEISAAYNNIGGVYYYKGDYDLALENYFESLKLREQLQDPEAPALLSQSYNNLALIFKVKGLYDDAIKNYRMSLSIKQNLGDYEGMCTSLSNMGALYLEMDELDSAQINLEKSLDLALEHGVSYNVHMSRNNLALIYIRKNELAKAEQIYYEILYSIDPSDAQQTATAHVNLSNVLFLMKQYSGARTEAKLALDSGVNSGSLVVQENALHLLYSIEEADGNYKAAFNYLEQYTGIQDSIYNIDSDRRFSELLVEYETEKKADSIIILNQNNSLLSSEKELSDQKAEKRKWISYLLAFGIIALLISFVLVIRTSRTKKTALIRENKLKFDSVMSEIDALRARLESGLDDQPKTNLNVDQSLLNDYLNNPLSDRELDVLKEVASGKTNKEIAETLFVSVNTVKTHIMNIYVKLDVQNRTQAALKAGNLQILKK